MLLQWGPCEVLTPTRRRDRLVALCRLHFLCRSADLDQRRLQRRHVDVRPDHSARVRFIAPKEKKSNEVARSGPLSPWISVEPNTRFPALSLGSMLRSYLDDTAPLITRSTDTRDCPVFLTLRCSRTSGLHNGLSRDRLANIFRSVLSAAGVDTQRYGAHSSRGAVSSTIVDQLASTHLSPLATLVLDTARWGRPGDPFSKRVRTFSRFYYKPTSTPTAVVESPSITAALWRNVDWSPPAHVSVAEFFEGPDYWFTPGTITSRSFPELVQYIPATASAAGRFQMQLSAAATTIELDHGEFMDLVSRSRRSDSPGTLQLLGHLPPVVERVVC